MLQLAFALEARTFHEAFARTTFLCERTPYVSVERRAESVEEIKIANKKKLKIGRNIHGIF
jgi:hypothetical protein